MAKKYIELEAAIRALQPTHAPAINEVLASVLRRVPAADVVEVVRCHDCFYREKDGADIVCTGPMAYYNTPDDWYCASGKRRDGVQDDV